MQPFIFLAKLQLWDCCIDFLNHRMVIFMSMVIIFGTLI